MEKYMIREFAALNDVTPRMLRHYDKMDILKPDYVDPYTGYRYYSKAQCTMVNLVLLLKDMEFSLPEIREIMNGMDKGHLLDMLRDKEHRVVHRIKSDIARRIRIENLIGLIQGEKNMQEPFDFTKLDAQSVDGLRKRLPSGDFLMDELKRRIDNDLLDMDQLYCVRLDIDKFMAINDDFGYDVGDAVIDHCFDIMVQHFNTVETADTLKLLARMGGDEMTWIISGVDGDALRQAVRQALDAVAAYDFGPHGCDRRVTMTAGVYRYDGVSDPRLMTGHAHKALMRAKHHARGSLEMD